MNNVFRDFTYNPVQLDIPRSKLQMKHSHKTTFNTGQIIPIYWREVVPGSTVKMEMAEVTRMQTPIFPIMDNAFIDTYFFFCPNRILWEHWEEFMGENKSGFWEQPIEYEVPQISFNSNNEIKTEGAPLWIKGDKYYTYAVQAGSLADYMGCPIVDANSTTPSWRGEFSVNALPFRAYYQIFNDWFRDENLVNPMEFDKGDTTIVAEMSSADQEAVWPLVPPAMASKYHDYFTSALPQPQKHDDVMLPLGTTAPVILGENIATGNTTNEDLVGKMLSLTGSGEGPGTVYGTDPETGSGVTWTSGKANALYADLTTAVGASINELRTAFAIQRYYEKEARSGSRYIEKLKAFFGVTSPDGRLQRAEYLGGCRKAINIDQVVQTSATDETSPQGNTAAYSMTSQNEELFTKSFVEHGILMGIQVIRTEHSYQDGLNRMWLRKNKFDYYDPTFANLGEQAILNKEIYVTGSDVSGSKDEEAFGYQERWAEYRYAQNRVSGEFRSKYHQTLDAWHFADNYNALPSLSFAWMTEYETQMNRNIAVSSRLADQWMSDIFFEETWTQPMPVYSIPGLIDHF